MLLNHVFVTLNCWYILLSFRPFKIFLFHCCLCNNLIVSFQALNNWGLALQVIYHLDTCSER